MSEYVNFSNKSEKLQTTNEKLTTKINEKQSTIISLQSDIDTLENELSGKTEHKERLRGAYDGAKDLFTGKSSKKVKEAEEKRDKAIATADTRVAEAQSKVKSA